MSRFALLAAAALLSAPLPTPAAAESGLEVVYCHDVERDLVQRIRARNCTGQILSPDQARQTYARIEAERQARRARVLGQAQAREQTGLRFQGAGTAFAVNHQGALLTSAHVVRGCAALDARRDTESRAFRARIVARDEANDLALLKIDRRTTDIIAFSTEPVADGNPLALIGYPIEGMIRRVPRLTPVLASHAISNPAARGLLGVAGDVRRGNSGGPALDSKGRAVGVLKAKVNSVAAKRVTGKTLTNLGVVVDRRVVVNFLNRAKTPFAVANASAREKSGRSLFALGRSAVYRIDCMVRKPADPKRRAGR